MEEQPIITSEPRKEGNVIKKIALVLLVLATLLLVLAYAQDSEDSADNSKNEMPATVVDTEWRGGTTPEFHDLEVSWVYSSAINDTAMYPQRTSELAHFPATCEIGFGQAGVDEPSVLRVATYVGYCFHMAWLETPTEPWKHNPNDWQAFGVGYANAYIEKCGEVYAPLGFGGVEDSNCEPPNPSEVAQAIFGWDTP